MNKINAESIIFDLDGTLWDSADNVAGAWNTVIERLDMSRLNGIYISGDDLRSTMGMTMDDLARHFFPMLSEESQIRLLKKCMEFENDYVAEHGGRLYIGEEKTLKQLALSHRLFIVSNCQCGYIEAFMQYSGLGKYFSGYMCWGDTKSPKSTTIRLLMEKYSCETAAYVGDTEGDCKSALEAEIPFVHAAYGFGKILCPEHISAAADNFCRYIEIFG